MPTVTKMGWEGELFYGVAGSTAATKITNCRDESYNIEKEYGETTTRGDGSAPPIETQTCVARRVTITWTMINKPADTTLTALLAAAVAGTAVAIRTKSYSSGTGFDGDCEVSANWSKPFKGEQTIEFTATPTLESGRTPLLNA